MKIKRCPKCRSNKIELFAGAITGSYHCRECGIITPMVLEEEIDTKKLKKKSNK